MTTTDTTDTTDTTADERTAAIHRLVEDVQSAQSDPEPFLARHTPDAIVVNFGGRRVLGRDALQQAMTAALASPMAQVTTTSEVDDIRFVRPDVAVVSATKHIHDARPTPDKFTAEGKLTYVVVEQDGAWRIALAQTTPVAT